jgi:uncharacterized RmlC-like cupin family protein
MKQIPLEPSKIKAEQGLIMIDRRNLPLPSTFDNALPEHLVTFLPGGWGGDHTHEREEAFISFSPDAYMVWRDDQGERHEERMMDAPGQHYLFIVPSNLPHLIENRGDTPAILYELMDRDDGPATMLPADQSLRRTERGQ